MASGSGRAVFAPAHGARPSSFRLCPAAPCRTTPHRRKDTDDGPAPARPLAPLRSAENPQHVTNATFNIGGLQANAAYSSADLDAPRQTGGAGGPTYAVADEAGTMNGAPA